MADIAGIVAKYREAEADLEKRVAAWADAFEEVGVQIPRISTQEDMRDQLFYRVTDELSAEQEREFCRKLQEARTATASRTEQT